MRTGLLRHYIYKPALSHPAASTQSAATWTWTETTAPSCDNSYSHPSEFGDVMLIRWLDCLHLAAGSAVSLQDIK